MTGAQIRPIWSRRVGATNRGSGASMTISDNCPGAGVATCARVAKPMSTPLMANKHQGDASRVRQPGIRCGCSWGGRVTVSCDLQSPDDARQLLKFCPERNEQLPAQVVIGRIGIGRSAVARDISRRNEWRVLVQ